MISRGVVTEEGGRSNVYAIEPRVVVDDTQTFGFNEYAEKVNGRLAMIGFVALLIVEICTRQGLVGWLANL
jgi:hypothetical protein